jgi:hypothetical protein
MKFSAGSIPWLLLVWAFYLGMGLPLWPAIPFILLVIGTILYLVSFGPLIVTRSTQ